MTCVTQRHKKYYPWFAKHADILFYTLEEQFVLKPGLTHNKLDWLINYMWNEVCMKTNKNLDCKFCYELKLAKSTHLILLAIAAINIQQLDPCVKTPVCMQFDGFLYTCTRRSKWNDSPFFIRNWFKYARYKVYLHCFWQSCHSFKIIGGIKTCF